MRVLELLIALRANEHDLNQTGELLHGDAAFIFVDAGDRGAEKRKKMKCVKADRHVAERLGQLRALKKHPRKHKVSIRTEDLKAKVRAKVEHPFGSSNTNSVLLKPAIIVWLRTTRRC